VKTLVIGAFVASSLLAPAAWAKPPADPLATAKAAAKAGDVLGAAKSFGAAIAAAQKAHDLVAESDAVAALEEWLEKLPEPAGASAPTTTAAPGPQHALVALLGTLDPKRNGAFASAHAVAVAILAGATRTGEATGVAEAAAVLDAHAPTPKSGAAAPLLAMWAKGVAAARAGDAADADKALEAAAKAFAGHGWTRLAALASVELAAVRAKVKDDAKTAEALEIAAAGFGDAPDLVLVQQWIGASRARLAGASEAALAPVARLDRAFGRVAPPSSNGGRGGDSLGPGARSDVAKYLDKVPPTAPIVEVKATNDGLVIRLPFRDAPTKPIPFPHEQRPWEDRGGVTLELAGHAIAFHILDLIGSAAQPNDQHVPSRVRAFYPLAVGETWRVAKNGTVTVGP